MCMTLGYESMRILLKNKLRAYMTKKPPETARVAFWYRGIAYFDKIGHN